MKLDSKHVPTASDQLSPCIIRRFTAGLHKRALYGVLAGVAAGFLALSGAQAAVTYSGDLGPADPTSWTTSNDSYIGRTANGSLSLDGGSTVISASSYYGYNAGVMGTATVTGAGSLLTVHGMHYLGYDGTGVLNIFNGGAVNTNSTAYVGNNIGASGTVNVDGAGSLWTIAYPGGLNLGVKGTGAMFVTNGAAVESIGTVNANLGSQAGSMGTALVSGAGSKWNISGSLAVGNQGTGVLTISNGGAVSNSSNGNVGYNAGSLGTVTVDGAGSKWTNSSNVTVGGSGTGVLNVVNGGAASGANLALGSMAGAAGTVTVDGAGSSWTGTGTLTVGNSAGTGSGTINITNGSVVTVTAATTVGAAGKIDFGSSNGGTLTTSMINSSPAQLLGVGTINTSGIIADGNIVYNAANPTTTQFMQNNITVNLTQTSANNLGVGYLASGSLSIRDGVQIASNNGYVGYGAGSTGTATVDGAGSRWTNSSLTVGNSAGTGAGTLNINNGGAVAVTNTTTVGTLGKINFSNGGTLTTGTLLAGGSQISGTGTINTSGVITDANIAFNASTGTAPQFQVNGVAVNLNQSSTKSLGVGYSGSGSMSITGGVAVASSSGYLGYNAGSTGTATVEGAGSRWTNSNLYVGYRGTGTLSVANGAAVSASSSLYVGSYSDTSVGTLNINGSSVTVTGNTYAGGRGAINFSNGGTLTTGALYGGSQLSGSGTINTTGIIADRNLVFDATHGANQTFTANGVAVNLNQSSSKELGAGYAGSGTLRISEGAQILSGTGYLGYNAGSIGTATIDGANSKWIINSGEFWAGFHGNGTLNITNGGAGNFATSVYIGGSAAKGAINVDGPGSYMGTRLLTVGSTGGNGTLAITNGGNVVSTGGNHVIGSGTGSVGSAIVSGANSRWTSNNYDIIVSYGGTGSLLIEDGAKVTSRSGVIGYGNTGSGIVTVDGAGSSWTMYSGLLVGVQTSSKMLVTNGGTVTSNTGAIGPTNTTGGSAEGVMTVDGAGSKWTVNSGTLTLGQRGIGKLSISNGGAVVAPGLFISNLSTLASDVGKGSSVNLGSGTLTNDGTIRLAAGAAAHNGTYTPIFYGAMTGSGSVRALGGVWNDTNHTVTVSSAVRTAAGTPATLDLKDTQRVLITDSATGKSVGASFQATSSSTSLSFGASAITGTELSSLQSLLDPGKSVLSGWDFTTSGYTEGNPVYLSLWAGSNTSLSDLIVWHYAATSGWSKFDAWDLAYADNFASFTVNGFSDYVVTGTAPVPIPAAAWLLGSGLVGLVAVRRRKMSLSH